MKRKGNASNTLKMVSDLKPALTKTQYKKCRILIEMIMHRMNYSKSIDWVSIPSKSIKYRLGDKYRSIIQILEDSGIIEVNRQYSENHCRRYKISDKALESKLILEESSNKTSEPKPYLEKQTHNVLKLLSCIPTEVFDFIDEYIESNEFLGRVRSIKGAYHKNPVVEVIMDRRSNRKNYLTLRNAKVIAINDSKSLIQDGDKYYLTDKKKYLARKKLAVRASYRMSAERIINHNWYSPKRHEENLRLNSAITNLPNVLLPYVKLEGETIHSIDLSNSQIVLLTKLIEEIHAKQPTPFKKVLEEIGFYKDFADGLPVDHNSKLLTSSNDFKRYRTHVQKGQIYEIMAEQMGITRQEAKISMLQFQYSHPTYSTKFKKKLKELFPSVVLWVDAFKKKYDQSQLAILLQRIEANLFIDKILKNLYKKKVKCLSKHDSILCKESDAEIVDVYVKRVLDEYLGKGCYNLKVEAV